MSIGLNSLYHQLKEKGIRLTPQRMAILEFLRETKRHPRADEIHEHIKKRFPGVSLATVYNNLNVLKDKGLVLELSYGDLASRFDGMTANHYHITCEKCGKVVDFFYPPITEIEKEASESANFSIRGHRVELYGVCGECRAESQDGEKDQ